MYQLIEAYDYNESLGKEIREVSTQLCKYLSFDDWKIIMFTKDKRYGFIQSSSEGEFEQIQAGHEKIFFDRSKQTSYLNLLLDEKKIIYYKNTSNHSSDYTPISQNAFIELYFPLFSDIHSEKDIIGCFYLSKKDCPERDLLEFMSNIYVTTQMKIIQKILIIFYHEYIKEKEFFKLIHILKGIIKTREPLTVSHPFNVAYLCNLMGMELGFSTKQLQRLYMAATLHDIGKVFVSEAILSKPGPLTQVEKAEIKRHPIHSYNIVKVLANMNPDLAGIEDIVLQHHERYDGSGYPDGLKGEEILVESRILGIADQVDALLSERCYKKAKPLATVLRDLKANRGRRYDPILAQMMINILTRNYAIHEVILKEPVVIGTIEILTKKRICQLQGTLIKTNIGYRFEIDSNECLCEECVANLPDIISISFFTEYNGKLYEYSVSVKGKDGHQIYLNDLTYKPSDNYFSLLWELQGALSYYDTLICEAKINRIGGDFLTFYINRNQLTDVNAFRKTNNVTIIFEDGSAIMVAGKITKIMKVNYKLYCEFKYLNIPESTRDKIFRYIFQKQASLRAVM